VLLNWVRAKKDHKPLLQGFVCADPPKPTYHRLLGKTHPAMWTVEVQSAIHKYPVGKTGHEVLLGFDGDTLAVVVTYHLVSASECWMEFLACAVEYQGLGLGRQAINRVMEDIQRDYDMELSCKARTANLRSQRMLLSAGFEMVDQNDKYQIWTRDVIGADVDGGDFL
jgi:ribosomal protein S18 acetylase RimI-like enzyme